MKEIKISRKRWLRGTGFGSLLASGSNKMCCLGFVGRAEGLTRKQMLDVLMPAGVCRVKGALLLPKLVRKQRNDGYSGYANRAVTDNLSKINDDTQITDAVREKKLTKLAAKAGFKFVFVP